jgi:hypothetical protein
MAVGFMRWLRCADTIQTGDGIAIMVGTDVIAPLLCAAIATDAASRTPANDHRSNVLRTLRRAHALHRGGAID